MKRSENESDKEEWVEESRNIFDFFRWIRGFMNRNYYFLYGKNR